MLLLTLALLADEAFDDAAPCHIVSHTDSSETVVTQIKIYHKSCLPCAIKVSQKLSEFSQSTSRLDILQTGVTTRAGARHRTTPLNRLCSLQCGPSCLCSRCSTCQVLRATHEWAGTLRLLLPYVFRTISKCTIPTKRAISD